MDKSQYNLHRRDTQKGTDGHKHTDRHTEGTTDLEAFRLEGDSMEHGGVDHDIVGVVQDVCIEGPTGAGLMHHPPRASRHQRCVHLQWTGPCTACTAAQHEQLPLSQLPSWPLLNRSAFILKMHW